MATCPYFTRKSGIRYNESSSSLFQNFYREFQPSKDQRALFSELPFASIMGNLPEITLQYLWIAITYQRMEIKSSFQDSIYKLSCAPLCHAVNSSWFQLNLEIKKIHKRSCLGKPALVLSWGDLKKLRLCGFSFEIVHYRGMPMGYKFGNIKQAASSSQDWYYLELEHIRWYTHSILQAFCNVIKDDQLFDNYHYNFKMYNNYVLELNS